MQICIHHLWTDTKLYQKLVKQREKSAKHHGIPSLIHPVFQVILILCFAILTYKPMIQPETFIIQNDENIPMYIWESLSLFCTENHSFNNHLSIYIHHCSHHGLIICFNFQHILRFICVLFRACWACCGHKMEFHNFTLYSNIKYLRRCRCVGMCASVTLRIHFDVLNHKIFL